MDAHDIDEGRAATSKSSAGAHDAFPYSREAFVHMPWKS